MSRGIQSVRGGDGAPDLDALRAAGGEVAARGEPVCVLRDEQGDVAGASFALASDLPPVAGLPFWLAEVVVRAGLEAHAHDLTAATYRALAAEFDPDEGPLGVALLLGAAARRHHPAEAQWDDPPFLYAGYLEDDRQLRIAYFPGANIGNGRIPVVDVQPLEGGLEVRLFADQDVVSAQDVVEMWTRDGELGEAEAQRRVHELAHVVIDPAGRPVAASTVYLVPDPRLHADLSYFRTFVSAEHRRSGLAALLAFTAYDHFSGRWLDGTDRRARGAVLVIESDVLRGLTAAVWPKNTTFIGVNDRGDHVRVLYYPGALAPEPPPP